MADFRNITQAEVDAYPYRIGLLKLQEKPVKGKRPVYIDSGAVALSNILMAFYERRCWTTLDAALSELERLYGYESVGVIVQVFSQIICGEKEKAELSEKGS